MYSIPDSRYFLSFFSFLYSTNTMATHLHSDALELQVTEMPFQAQEQGRKSLLIT